MGSRPETRRRASDHARWKAGREPIAPVRLREDVPLVRPKRLSNREAEVLALLAQGTSVEVVADRLFISVETVHSHTVRACAHLGVCSKVEAVRAFVTAQEQR